MLSYEPPYIPTSLEFIRDSRLDLQDEKGERERPELDLPDDRAALVEWQSELQVRKIRWHDGAVAGQLKTGAFTNANVINVPLEFTFNTFLPSGKSRRTYEATITNIATKQIHSGFSTNAFLPPVLSKLAVQDTRFRFRAQATNVNNIYYKLQDVGGLWQPRDSTNLTIYYLNSFAHGKRHRFSIFSENTKRYILVGVFLTATVVPLVLLISFQFRN
jgi:hypothetical protein